MGSRMRTARSGFIGSRENGDVERFLAIVSLVGRANRMGKLAEARQER
jgi:hypothetical protein